MYQSLYKEIIDTAKGQVRQKHQGVYYELHHIVPEFMFKNRKRTGHKGHLDGDSYHPDNLVLLTFQEHLMCHYYLYEIHKGTRYEYQAGTALQFFFVKAGGNHTRQIQLSEVDQEFLTKMSHLREIGISSISKARKGKMPVVDAVTRQKIGSVPVNHPRVLSGEWVHHSKGKPGHKNYRNRAGDNNNNFKPMTCERRRRVIDCVGRSLVDDNYFSPGHFSTSIKAEFSEFKKVSLQWVIKNFESLGAIVEEYNRVRNQQVIYNPTYKSSETRVKIGAKSETRRWLTNGQHNKRVSICQVDEFLLNNPDYSKGRTNA